MHLPLSTGLDRQRLTSGKHSYLGRKPLTGAQLRNWGSSGGTEIVANGNICSLLSSDTSHIKSPEKVRNLN